MRLSRDEVSAITAAAARVFGPTATVRLFGSRVDDSLGGGDIDLYVEVDAAGADVAGLAREWEFAHMIRDRIGDQKIDVLVHERGRPLRPIDRLADATGVLLDAAEPGSCVQLERPASNALEPVLMAASRDLLTESIAMAEAVAIRLRHSQQVLGAFLPTDAERFAALDLHQQMLTDAMLKQFESLQDIMQRRVFRAFLSVQNLTVRGLSHREIGMLVHRQGALRDLDCWRGLADLRNELAHDYPLDLDRRARCINRAYAAIGPLLEILDALKEDIARRSFLDPDTV